MIPGWLTIVAHVSAVFGVPVVGVRDVGCILVVGLVSICLFCSYHHATVMEQYVMDQEIEVPGLPGHVQR